MDTKDLEVENYEHNLKLHYEAKRKELDILLTSSIPTQFSNMKTLLWINFLMVGFMLHALKKFPMPDILIGFFILSVCSILSVFLAMLLYRTKSYGVPDNIKYMSIYADNEWTKCQATFDMLDVTHEAVKDNRIMLQKKAKFMHIGTWLTFASLLFAIISFVMMQNQ